MKTSGIFWGILFISIGILFLLGQFSMLNFSLHFAFNLWPLILVFWGISFLNVGPVIRKILAGVSAVILALFFTAFFHEDWFPHFGDNINFIVDDENNCDTVYSKSLTYPIDSNRTVAKFRLDAGAGMFSINDTTSELIDVYSPYEPQNYNFKVDTANGNYEVYLSLKKTSIGLKHHKSSREVSIKLNPRIIWDIDLNIGASSFDCNLSNYYVKNAVIKAGAASLEIKLGTRYDSAHYRIDAGASAVEISIPNSAGCEIHSSTGLSSKDFQDFLDIGSGKYQSKNYYQSKKKIFIEISGGVSSFDVNTYTY